MSKKRFVAELLLNTDAETVKGRAHGEMHIPTGELLVTHDYESIPESFNLGILPVGALTGTPEPLRPIGDVVNPFLPAREYAFSREVKFDGFDSTLTVKGHYQDDGHGGRSGSLEFQGNMPTMEEIIAIEPTTEVWLPGKEIGSIDGSFTMSFLLKNGDRLVARTRTAYKVIDSPAAKDFKCPHFRYITIQASCKGACFKQEEQISYFQSPGGHDPHTRNLVPIL